MSSPMARTLTLPDFERHERRGAISCCREASSWKILRENYPGGSAQPLLRARPNARFSLSVGADHGRASVQLGKITASPIQSTQRLVERPKPAREALHQARLPGFADVNLVERLQAQVRSLVLVADDLLQIDVEDFRLPSFDEVRTDDVNFARRRAGCDTAGAT